MGGESGTSHMGNTYYYYKCGKAKRHGKAHCDLKAIRKEPLERFWFEKFRKGDMRDMEHQRQIIDTFVNSVYVFDDRVVLNFNFTDDSKTISREEVLGSSAVENAPPSETRYSLAGFLFCQEGMGGRNCRNVRVRSAWKSMAGSGLPPRGRENHP